MQQHLLHPELLRQGTGVLTASPAKATEHRLPHIVALLDRDAPDRFRHPLQGHRQHPLSSLFRGALQAIRQPREALPHHLPIQGFVALRAKDRREALRPQAPQQQVGIGDRERASAAITGRARIRPGGFGPHPQALTIELHLGSTTGRHGVDVEHGRLNRQARQLHLLPPRPGAIAVTDIGGGAAHVEAHDPIKPRRCGRAHRPHQPPGRSREDRVLRPQLCRRGEHTARLHHPQGHMGAQGRLQLLQIRPQHRAHRSLEHGGVSARHQARQRTHLMGEGDLLKTKRLQPGAELPLMARICGAMEQRHRNTAAAIGPGLLQRLLKSVIKMQGLELPPLGIKTALHFNHLLMERFRARDR